MFKEKSVDEANADVLEPIAKSVVLVSPFAPKTESLAKGEVVPIPTLPTLPSKKSGDTPALPKRTVEDAWNPPERRMGVPVELVTAPKFVVVVQGNANVW